MALNLLSRPHEPLFLPVPHEKRSEFSSVAARRSEISELQQLALNCALVGATGRLIHALQRERGLSNLYLGSGGTGFTTKPLLQARETDRCATQLRALFLPPGYRSPPLPATARACSAVLPGCCRGWTRCGACANVSTRWPGHPPGQPAPMCA